MSRGPPPGRLVPTGDVPDERDSSTTGTTERETTTMDDVRDSMRRQGLVRPRQGRLLAGVCAGLGRRFNISPGIARLLFVVILFVLPGSQFLIYPLLWFLMPEEGWAPTPTGTPYQPPRA